MAILPAGRASSLNHSLSRRSLQRSLLVASAICSLAFLSVGCATEKPATMADIRRPASEPLIQPEPPKVVAKAPANRDKPAARPPVRIQKEEPVAIAAPIAGIPRDWTPKVAANNWQYIVIHHSATPVGGAARFNKEHQAKGWDELGYHFVIGNGTDTAAGAIEVGSRWPKQKWGAHCKTPDERFNKQGIGICLVGNFDQTQPSEAQLKAVARLVAYLQKTYRIPADHIIGHGDAKATECPGKNLHIAQVRRLSSQMLADAGESLPPARAAASKGRELLVDTRDSR